MGISTERLLLQLKALADPVRMRLVALCRHGECSVAELTQVTGQSQPRVSQHLKQLCGAGLLERFRDGKRVYYRLPALSRPSRALLDLVPQDDREIAADGKRLRRLRTGWRGVAPAAAPDGQREIYRALLDLTVTAPIGDLLDVGCGRGRMLKLLASRARRAVGVDIDASARQLARAELMLAGLPNCSLRQGDVHRLPFAEAEFDTVILDDLLLTSADPVRALSEAHRLLRRGGRVIVLQQTGERQAQELRKLLGEWSAAAGLRLAPGRVVPDDAQEWLLAVAVPADERKAAA